MYIKRIITFFAVVFVTMLSESSYSFEATSDFNIKKATITELLAVVDLAMQRHVQYEKYEPTFWKIAKGARIEQTSYLKSVMENPKDTLLIAEKNSKVIGMIMAVPMESAPVYDPGGTSYMIDDFVVSQPELWSTVGQKLLDETRKNLLAMNVKQIVLACGHADKNKMKFLKKQKGFSIATDLWVNDLD